MNQRLILLYIVCQLVGCGMYSPEDGDTGKKNKIGTLTICDGGWLNTLGPVEDYNHCENFLD